MGQFIDELDKLKRDLTGLCGLLYAMSDSADRGGCIGESELMLLAEIVGRSAETIENINDELEHTDNEDMSKWQEELCNIFKRLDLVGRAEVLVYANKVEKKVLEREA